jgi:predicted alpha-1,2-mannosidase
MSRRGFALFVALLGGCACVGICSAEPTDPVSLVDPFIGTGGIGGPNEGQTADFPGAAAPFGMLDWSPDTPTQRTSGGYWYHDNAITGFSLTHVAGAGCQIFGDFDMLPTVGTVANPTQQKAPFAHSSEIATPGYYAVTLGSPAINVQLATTQRSGLGYFTFPATTQANLLVNVSSDQAGVTDSEFERIGPNEIAGYASSGSFCGMPNTFTVYFDAQFDRPFVAHGTWNGESLATGANDVRGTSVGGWLTFDTTRDPTVKVKVAVSYVSIAGARANIAAEATTWDIAYVRTATASAWRRLLDRVRVTGNTLAERRMFYTALYHTFLDPNIFSDADGSYLGFDGKLHRDAPGHTEYANFSGWDTYRTTMSLQALLAPQESSDMIESLVHAAQQGGWLPKWPVANGYTGVMGGDSADPLIASAYAFGAHGFDRRAALAAMIKGATDTTSAPGQGWYVERPELAAYLRQGYIANTHTNSVSPVPNGASETLEYALDDFSIAQYARALGNFAVYHEFMDRSGNWTNLFNTATGLIAPRGQDGAFMQPPLMQNGESGFQEGNAWQYTWMVPQSLGVLVKALGGPQATVAKLDAFFSSANAGPGFPFSWLGNQPTFGSDWVYLWAGAPYREQLVTHEMLTAVYSPTPDGIPGNDDLASMSAWWAWSAMGMYPIEVSVRAVTLGTPLFTHISIRAPGGPRIEVSAPQASDTVAYVESLRINQRLSQRAWTPLPEAGTLRLDYTLGTTPNIAWAATPRNGPPTYVVPKEDFPPATAATLLLPTTNIALGPGESAALQFVLSNEIGKSSVHATWTAAVPPGLSLQPSSGSVRVSAYDKHQVSATIAAGADVASGLYDIAISGKTDNGALLPSIYVPVRNTRPGQPSRFAYAANFSDGTVVPIDLRTGAFGAPVQVGLSPGDLAVGPDGSRIYAANQQSNDVSIIDASQQSVVSTVSVGKVPAGIRLSPDGSIIWVTNNGDGTLQAIEAKRLATLATIPVGTNPEELAVAPDGSMVYVVDQGSNEVTPVNARTFKAESAIAVGRRPFGIAISADGKTLYVSNMVGNSVSVVDLERRRTVATVSVGKVPQNVTLSPDGSTLYVADSASMSVTPVDTKTNTAKPSITVGNGPFDIAFAPDGTTALVADTGDNEIAVLNVRTSQVERTIPTGNFPIAVAFR